MCLMILDAHAGMQRQSPPSTTIAESTKRAYNEKGDVDLEPLLNLKAGDTVAFKVGDEIVVGRVERREASSDIGLKLFGTFPEHSKAGFLFHFGAANTIKGLLFFVDRNAVYNLILDETNMRLSFERRDLKPRETPPTADTRSSK